MRKIGFFLNFYRTQKLRFLVLILIFAFAGAILSCSMLVRNNADAYSQAQTREIIDRNIVTQGDGIEGLDALFNIIEKVMTVFSLGSILIVVWGCTSILFFQNISMQKSHAMLRIFGLQKKDIFFRACVEGVSFGLMGGILGDTGGYFLFTHLLQKLCSIDAYIAMFSIEMLKALFVSASILILIAFFGSFISGIYIYETPIVKMLYGREAGKGKKTYLRYIFLELILLYIIVSAVFFKNWSYVNIMLIICGTILLMLFGLFHLIFQGQSKKRNNAGKVLDKISGLSYRFMCTRNKRDALLASTISVGAIIICLVLNIVFNFSGMLRDAYRDNMGYSTAVKMFGVNGDKRIEEILDENGYLYTKLYLKWMPYSELNGTPVNEGQEFYALVIDKQTDNNKFFQVPEGSFMAEKYFEYQYDLNLGEESSVCGKDLVFSKRIKENQWMSLINYQLKINYSDWKLGVDDTWETYFLMDVERSEEKNLQMLLAGENCYVETASIYVDALLELLSDYLSIVSVVGVMLIMVTATFFYSMVRSDLLARKKELYLYQMYGASRKQAFWVVYREYLMIAWIASFSVVFVTMILGEAFFGAMLNKHYPLSVPVTLITSLVVTVFVLVCCYIAQWINFMGEKMEIIRDE